MGVGTALGAAKDALATLAAGMCQDARVRIELVPAGWSWDPVRRVIAVSQRDLEHMGIRACAGILAHEVAHQFITRAHLFRVQFPSFRAWMMLLNGIEDPRVETWIVERYPGCGPWLDEANASYVDRERGGRRLPAFFDFCYECASEEARGWEAAPPRIARGLDPLAIAALERTRPARIRYAEVLPPADLAPVVSRAQLARAYRARVAPALPSYAMRIVPEPAEQLVRLAAREALDVAVGSVVGEALELYRRDVDRIAHTLEPSRDLRTRCEQLLVEGDLPAVLDAIAGCAAGSSGPAPTRETMRLAQRVLEGAIELLQRGGAPAIVGVRGGGRGACRVLVAAPLVGGVRRGGMVPWVAGRLPPLELDWRRDDYDQIFAKVAPQLHPLAHQVRRLLVPRRRLGRKSGYPSGQRADLRRLMRCEADPRRHDEIWERKTIPSRHATEFLLLVDLSGSMRGAKTEAALAGTVLFAEMLSSLSVAFAVVGFQDVLIPLLAFDQPFSAAARRRLLEIRAEVAAARPGGNNRPDYNDDGPCLREAAAMLLARPASDRVLIAISDGLPEGHRSTAVDLTNAVGELSRERSLRLIGVGLGPDTSHVADYYPHALASVPLEEFADEIGRVLEGVLAG